MPLTNACASRSATVPLRHSRSTFFSFAAPPLTVSENSTRRSVASSRRFNKTLQYIPAGLLGSHHKYRVVRINNRHIHARLNGRDRGKKHAWLHAPGYCLG